LTTILRKASKHGILIDGRNRIIQHMERATPKLLCDCRGKGKSRKEKRFQKQLSKEIGKHITIHHKRLDLDEGGGET
jgi:hypothetical protein